MILLFSCCGVVCGELWLRGFVKHCCFAFASNWTVVVEYAVGVVEHTVDVVKHTADVVKHTADVVGQRGDIVGHTVVVVGGKSSSHGLRDVVVDGQDVLLVGACVRCEQSPCVRNFAVALVVGGGGGFADTASLVVVVGTSDIVEHSLLEELVVVPHGIAAADVRGNCVEPLLVVVLVMSGAGMHPVPRFFGLFHCDICKSF